MPKHHLKGRWLPLALCMVLFADARAGDPVRLAADEYATIRGRILDRASRDPLPHTNVFLAHTTLGVITGLDGHFHLKRIAPGTYQLVVNRVGYQTFTREITLQPGDEQVVEMRLEQKTIDGGEVEVVASIPKVWRSQLQRFKEAFIGETSNGRKCVIENPEVLRFEIESGSSDLIATSDSTLHITNHSLGYRLYVIIDQFRWGRVEGLYSIYPRFEELEARDEEEMKKWRKQRRATYYGSFRHFIACLANRSAEMDGYQMFLKEIHEMNNAQGTRVFTDQIVSTMPGMGQQLHFDGMLQVIYRGSGGVSSIRLKQNHIIIKSSGEIYPPLHAVLYGVWANHRIADILPLDYHPQLLP